MNTIARCIVMCYDKIMLKTNTIQRGDLHTIIRKEVVDVVTELLSDPESGLELNPSFEKRLKKSTREKTKGKVTLLANVLAQFSV
jgi:hypothetical protein